MTQPAIASPLRFLLLTLVFSCSLVVAGWFGASAQGDPCADFGATYDGDPNAPKWKQGDTVYVEMQYDFDQAIKDQVTAAFASWTEANQTNNSYVTYVIGRPANAPPNASQINIGWTTLHNEDGSVNHTAKAQLQRNSFNSDGSLRQATLVFNSAAVAKSPDPNSGPYYDPSKPGYGSVFAKEARHEVGHGQAINHPVSQQPGQSVMNESPFDVYCPNNGCGTMPEDGVQPCDNAAVSKVYPPVVFTSPDDGGGEGPGDSPCLDRWGMETVYNGEGDAIGYRWIYYGCS